MRTHTEHAIARWKHTCSDKSAIGERDAEVAAGRSLMPPDMNSKSGVERERETYISSYAHTFTCLHTGIHTCIQWKCLAFHPACSAHLSGEAHASSDSARYDPFCHQDRREVEEAAEEAEPSPPLPLSLALVPYPGYSLRASHQVRLHTAPMAVLPAVPARR